MTYRRLFHVLLVCGTLALAGAWWVSWRQSSEMGVTLPGVVSIHVKLSISTLMAWIDLDGEAPPIGMFWIDLDSMSEGERLHDQEVHGHFGFFEWTAQVVPWTEGSFLAFPVWVPWLVFVAASFGFCRIMERRSGGKEEKMTAAETSADGEPDIPD